MKPPPNLIVTVAMKGTGSISGSPRIQKTYQVLHCNDRICTVGLQGMWVMGEIAVGVILWGGEREVNGVKARVDL